MSDGTDGNVLEALLDSWDRSNTILLNLLRALPDGGLEARAMQGSPTVAAVFTHIRDVRLGWVSQTASEFTPDLPQLFRQEGDGWQAERDPDRIAEMLEGSARIVRDAVSSRVESGQPLKGEHASYDHPILLLQHMLWHEGYHVGQIKLALKAMGYVMSDEVEEKTIWSVWRTETWE